ncbi:MAG: hypothetical protein OXE79_02805 [Acidimicrobiaceae bacterium]|nr:hypothetical protein [Acidimicrobiaceae bacterium]MCY4279729.1 hypothetical protein [Acidimicrobiaceae bacterium]MCY4293953.1 hypothetical protein [Acidimicrobiaceae bacterium]
MTHNASAASRGAPSSAAYSPTTRAAVWGTAPEAPPDCSTVFRPRYRLNFELTLMWVKTCKRRNGIGWWCSETPQGSAATAFRAVSGEIIADAWGPGAEWAVEQLPALLGDSDDPSGFRPLDPVISELAEKLGVPRLSATGRWYEATATAAIFQRVVSADARASVARMGRLFGAEAPGDAPLPVFPKPEVALRLPDHDFHRAGVDRGRSRVIRTAAKHADRLERLEGVPAAEARQWLERLSGIGPWTAARATAVAAADADAVPVGDLHVPRMVTYALSGIDDGDDDSMLELLAPYAGHRCRVIRLLRAAEAGPKRHFPAPTRFDIAGI